MVLARQFAIGGLDFLQRGIGANVQGGIVIGPCFGSNHRSARAIPGGGGKPENWVMDFAVKIGSECGGNRERWCIGNCDEGRNGIVSSVNQWHGFNSTRNLIQNERGVNDNDS